MKHCCFISDYLNNVLDDLGIQISDTLRNIEALLQAKASEFTSVAAAKPQRITHAIASMRQIDL